MNSYLLKWVMMNTEFNTNQSINPLTAKLFWGNINIYLHFMLFVHTNKTQVVEIPPQARHGPAYST